MNSIQFKSVFHSFFCPPDLIDKQNYINISMSVLSVKYYCSFIDPLPLFLLSPPSHFHTLAWFARFKADNQREEEFGRWRFGQNRAASLFKFTISILQLILHIRVKSFFMKPPRHKTFSLDSYQQHLKSIDFISL